MKKDATHNASKHFVMDRWLHILENEPPRMVDTPILHHYTNAFGVHGIITLPQLCRTPPHTFGQTRTLPGTQRLLWFLNDLRGV
jgi:hypothetical protein